MYLASVGIPKKKSRSVEVDGVPFRFMVSQVTIPDHADQFELSVTVQEEHERPGGVLQFRLPYGFPVGPASIRNVVRQAKKAGWDTRSRKRFTLEVFSLSYP